MKKLFLLMAIPLIMGNANVKFTHQKPELFLERVEGFRTIAYKDTKSYAVCFGNRFNKDGSMVQEGDVKTRRECLEILHFHLETRTKLIFRKINVSLSENQKTAIISYCYRWGVSGCYNNGLVDAVNKRDYQRVRDLFINQSDAVSRGLKEYELFTTL